MKKIVSLVFLFLSAVSFSERLVVNPNLYIDSSIIFIKGEDKAYTGTLVNKDEEGRLLNSVDYKNGRLNGQAVFYYPSGCIEYLGIFKDEEPLCITLYYTNGNIFQKRYINQDNSEVLEEYYLNGEKAKEYVSPSKNENLIWTNIYYSGGKIKKDEFTDPEFEVAE